MWFEVRKWFKHWQKRTFHDFQCKNDKKTLWKLAKPRITFLSPKSMSHFITYVMKNIYKQNIVWSEVQKWFKHWQKSAFHDFQCKNAKKHFQKLHRLERLEWVQSWCVISFPMLWRIFRNTTLCDLRFISGSFQ